MRTIITALIFIIFISNNTYAQWTEQATGIVPIINSISAADNNVVWACGDFGKVLKTTNSGINWVVTNSPNVSRDYYTIEGINALTALVGGGPDTAVIYKTTDGGTTWAKVFRQRNGFTDAISGLKGFPGVYEFLGDPVGGRWSLFLSYDYGSTWDSAGLYIPSVSGEAGWNNSFFACTPGTYSFIGTNSSKLIQSFTNGSVVNHPTPGLTNSFSVWGNSNDKLMTGGSILLYSTNGGNNWANANAIGTGTINGITGAGSEWFYVRGTSVYHSSNDGMNWSAVHSVSQSYSDITISPFGSYLWAAHYGGVSRYVFDIPLPVELSSFISTVSGSNVKLNWSTSHEINNSGFDIERLELSVQYSGEWMKIGFVKGIGNATEINNYNYTDRGLTAGKYKYRLKQIDFNGNFDYHNLSDELIIGNPGKFSLSQNYPNPFNPSTNINYDLPVNAIVTLKIFDISGREIITLVNDFKTAGYYTSEFNASYLSTGMYLYRISAKAEGQTFNSEKRMVLLK